MFTSFQRYKQSIGKIIITLFVALLMLSFGMGMFNIGGAEIQRNAIIIDKTEITFNQFETEKEEIYNNTMFSLYQQYGEAFNSFAEQIDAEIRKSLPQQAVQNIIQKQLFAKFTKDIGLTASDTLVKNQIKKDVEQAFPQYGGLNKQSFSSYLRMLRTTEKKLEENTRKQILLNTLAKTITDSYIPSKAEIEKIYQNNNDKYAFSYLEFDQSKYINKVKIDDTELQDFFEKKQEQYRTPKIVDYSFVEFDSTTFKNEADVVDEDIVNEYEKRKITFNPIAKFKLRQIVFNKNEKNEEEKKELALNTKARLNNGEDFSKVASEISEDANTKTKGGDLGTLEYKDIPENIKDKVTTLEEGQLSEIINADGSYIIVLVEKITREQFPEFAQLKNKIIDDLKAELAPTYAKNAALAFIEEFQIRENHDTKLKEFAAMQKQEAQVKVAKTTEQTDKLGERALTMPQDTAELFEIDKKFFVIAINSIIDPAIPELKNIRAEVERDFRAEKSTQLAFESAKDVADKLSNGEDFKALANANDIVIKNIKPTARIENGAIMFQNSNIKNQVFALTPENKFSPTLKYGNSFYIFRLDNVEMAKQDKLAEQEPLIVAQEKNKFSNVVLNTLLTNLRNNATIKINDSITAEQ